MSKGWQGGSTRRWRKLRAYILRRDGHTCRMPTHPEVQALAQQRRINLTKICTTTATHAHHLDGVKAGLICPPNRLVAACASCNWAIGDPTDQTATPSRPADPTPNPPRTNW